MRWSIVALSVLWGCWGSTPEQAPDLAEPAGPAEPAEEVSAIEPEIETTVLHIPALKGCNECVFEVRSKLKAVYGTGQLKINPRAGVIRVKHQPHVTPQSLIGAVTEAGHEARVIDAEEAASLATGKRPKGAVKASPAGESSAPSEPPADPSAD